MRRHHVILPVLALVALPAAAAAQRTAGAPLEQLVQELFVSETVQPQQRGQLQATAKGSADRPDDGGGWPAHIHGIVEYGITDRWQLSLRTPDAGAHRDPDQRRTVPGIFVAVLPGSRPVSLSLFGEVEVARGLAPTTSAGVVVARGWHKLQLHATETLERSEGEVDASETVAALYDAGAWTPTLELAHQAEGVARWALVPGLYAHPGKSVEAGVGVPLSLVGGPAVTGVRLVVTLEVGG